ncbi:hypothetical protein ABZZ80_34395 [Streptomyces sp. NPDC006356]
MPFLAAGLIRRTGPSRIAVRHRMNGVPRYRIYDLDTFVAGDYTTHVADLAQAGTHPDPTVPFQGYALHGDHLSVYYKPSTTSRAPERLVR